MHLHTRHPPANQGVSDFENLQMSEHPMVRRAATEVLVNMAECTAVRATLSRSPNVLDVSMS